MTRDPVCGMEIQGTPAYTLDYHGQMYYVCSGDCKSRFQAEPDKYASSAMEATSMAEHSGHQHGHKHGCC